MFNSRIKSKAFQLRKTGHSFEEIARATGVSKGTLSLWLKDVVLDDKAQARIALLKKEGTKNAGIVLSQKRKQREVVAYTEAQKTIDSLPVFTKSQAKLACALIYYCEGNKSPKEGISFINSDPGLLKNFLVLLKKGFNIDSSKLKLCMHLHSYHNENVQKNFWLKVTDLSIKQFTKSFFKKEGGKYEKTNYPGCLRIRYHSTALARELLATADLYFKKFNF